MQTAFYLHFRMPFGTSGRTVLKPVGGCKMCVGVLIRKRNASVYMDEARRLRPVEKYGRVGVNFSVRTVNSVANGVLSPLPDALRNIRKNGMGCRSQTFVLLVDLRLRFAQVLNQWRYQNESVISSIPTACRLSFSGGARYCTFRYPAKLHQV